MSVRSVTAAKLAVITVSEDSWASISSLQGGLCAQLILSMLPCVDGTIYYLQRCQRLEGIRAAVQNVMRGIEQLFAIYGLSRLVEYVRLTILDH